MKTFKIFGFAILLYLLAGCEEGEVNTFKTNKSFQNKLTIPSLCKDGKKLNPFQEQRCVRTVKFYSNGSSELTLLDSQHTGSYYIQENTLYAFYGDLEESNQIEFAIIADASLLIDDVYGYSWVLVE